MEEGGTSRELRAYRFALYCDDEYRDYTERQHGKCRSRSDEAMVIRLIEYPRHDSGAKENGPPRTLRVTVPIG